MPKTGPLPAEGCSNDKIYAAAALTKITDQHKLCRNLMDVADL